MLPHYHVKTLLATNNSLCSKPCTFSSALLMTMVQNDCQLLPPATITLHEPYNNKAACHWLHLPDERQNCATSSEAIIHTVYSFKKRMTVYSSYCIYFLYNHYNYVYADKTVCTGLYIHIQPWHYNKPLQKHLCESFCG